MFGALGKRPAADQKGRTMSHAHRSSGSIKAVAALAGVSIATVSRVMNGIANKAGPETVARVRKAAAELDYRPISAGRALRSRQTRMVAVLASNLANPTMAAMAASAERALRKAGFVMVLCDTHDEPDLQDEYLREMRARQTHAIVLLGAVRSAALDRLMGGNERLVFVNRKPPSGGGWPFVGIDNGAAGADLAGACIRAGHRRFALVHGALTSSATKERLDAARASLAAAGIADAETRVLTSEGPHLDIGLAAGRALLSDPPDAVIALSDLIAFGAHRAFVDAAMANAPRIFGFDDNPLNEWIAPWLSSVRIPYADFGEAIVGALARDPRAERAATLLPHEIVLRDGG
jgi:LacI family transcriptional regulator